MPDQKDSGAASQREPYRVGYGKPPQHSQFPKGQSGNPRGRPKGRKNLRNWFIDFMQEEVSFTSPDGKKRKMSTQEALLRGRHTRAINGDSRAFDHILRFMELCGMLDQPPDRMALYDHYLKYTDDEVLLHLIGNVETAKATVAAAGESRSRGAGQSCSAVRRPRRNQKIRPAQAG